jgi:GTP cyclohydrolase I
MTKKKSDKSTSQKQKIAGYLKEIFAYLGENPEREGLAGTPERMIKSWDELFSGYKKSPKDILTVFKEDNVIPYEQIILLKDIEFFSTCEHHFLPFVGKAHVAYVPRDRVVGISKLARIVEIFARRLQIQERIGNEVTETIMKELNALGGACIIEAQHLCMSCRGVSKQHSVMVTSSLKGCFIKNPNTRKELLSLIHG